MIQIESAQPPDADEIRVLVARTITHSVTQDAALLADTIANVGRTRAALLLNAATGAVGFYEHLGFVARESTQVLPPGFKAMSRPV